MQEKRSEFFPFGAEENRVYLVGKIFFMLVLLYSQLLFIMDLYELHMVLQY